MPTTSSLRVLPYPLSRPCPIRQVFLTRRPAAVNDALRPWYGGASPVNSRTIMVVPLVIEGRAIGVLSLTNKQTGLFDADDVELAMLLAPHVALAIDAAAKHSREARRAAAAARPRPARARRAVPAIVSAPSSEPLAASLARVISALWSS
jgi:GAF domain-containing protein